MSAFFELVGLLFMIVAVLLAFGWLVGVVTFERCSISITTNHKGDNK